MVQGTEHRQNSFRTLDLNPCLLFFLSRSETGELCSAGGEMNAHSGKVSCPKLTAKQKAEHSLSSGQLRDGMS